MSAKIHVHPETGSFFTPTKKEGWVKCQLRTQELAESNGVISLQKRTAFPLIQQEVADLLEPNLTDGGVFPLTGKIIRTVTKLPQYDGHSKVQNPETKEKKNYYQSFTFTTNMNEKDSIEEGAIVKNEISQRVTQLTPNSDFDR